jgi:hypothetical protein
MSEDTAPKTYVGSCHCGKVRYEVTMHLAKVMECNCSICARSGYLIAFAPPGQFRLLAGEDAVTDYQFRKHNVHHLFCATCGVRSFGWGTGKDGARMHLVNVRCLEGVDPTTLEVTKVDGKSL